MKAANRCSFGIWKKYLTFPDLLLAFVWHLDGVEPPETYALTCEESIRIGEAMGWTKTASWTKGVYGTTRPGAEVCRLLGPYLMTPARWKERILAARR